MEKVTLAVYQLADDVKDIDKTVVGMVNVINHLSGKVSKFDEHLSRVNTEPPSFDTKKVEAVMSKGILDMSVMLDRKLKDSRRTYQLLLFPPQDARLFYKIVFGRWFLYFIIGFAILKISDWAVQESNNRASVEIEEAKFRNEIINKAWYTCMV